MAIHVKDSGVWKEAQGQHVRDGGVWKEVKDGYIKDGGVWKKYYGAEVPYVNGVEFTTQAAVLDDGGSMGFFSGYTGWAILGFHAKTGGSNIGYWQQNFSIDGVQITSADRSDVSGTFDGTYYNYLSHSVPFYMSGGNLAVSNSSGAPPYDITLVLYKITNADSSSTVAMGNRTWEKTYNSPVTSLSVTPTSGFGGGFCCFVTSFDSTSPNWWEVHNYERVGFGYYASAAGSEQEETFTFTTSQATEILMAATELYLT